MHGKAMVLGPNGERPARLVDAPLAPGHGDEQFDESPLGINLDAMKLKLPGVSLFAVMILLLALAAGAASIWLTEPVYSARATIQIDPRALRLAGTENIVPAAAPTGDDRLLRTQAELLASRSTAQKVAARLSLAGNPQFLRDVGLEDEPAGPARNAELTAALQQRLSLSAPRDGGLVDVRFDSHDPVAAARIANAFADTFTSDSVERRSVAQDYSRRFLRGQFELANARFEQAQGNLLNGDRAAGPAALAAAYSRAQAGRTEAQQRWQRWQQAMSAPAPGNPVSIVDRAQAPAVAAYPRPATNMALAALAGALALGAGMARNRTKVEAPADVEPDFDAELLGIVPLPTSRAAFALDSSDPLSPANEAHHAIFLALDRLTQTADSRVLLLTSSGPNEGKSMIAVKLSANFAAAGKKVLVVDTDMRRGSLQHLLGLSNRLGLADLLATDSTCELTRVAQYCPDRGFSVVPRGQSGTNPVETLASRRFAELLDEASTLYDVVIMDGPPVLGLADAPRLSAMADATVFVLRANRTLPEHARLALRKLSEAGAEQIGLVITEQDPAEDIVATDPADRDPAPDQAEALAGQPPTGPAPGLQKPATGQDRQPEPALPSSWASWVVAQQ